MSFPPPTEKQAHIIWAALTGLSIGLILALIAGAVWGLGQVLRLLAPVLWPLAVAGVLAYLLDPVVDFLERRRVPRTRAIVFVFLVAVCLILALFGSIVPQLVVETRQLVSNVPTLAAKVERRVTDYMNEQPAPLQGLLDRFGVHWGGKPGGTNAAPQILTNAPSVLTNAQFAEPNSPPPSNNSTVSEALGQLDPRIVQKVSEWVASALTSSGKWLAHQVSRLAGLFGIIAGVALIPIYLFYLLLEKRAIESKWTDYLPVTKSDFKDELVFVLNSINSYLIAFFRGQVLVAICDGILYTIGFLIVGLPYAILIGAMAIVLTMIPFLGAIVTCVAALVIALVQFGDWQHPLMVLAVFAVVQTLEGVVISPKIMGDRVGLHPLTIIIAVIAGTTLLGGLLGGILAIPLTAALKVLMGRYVWKRREAK